MKILVACEESQAVTIELRALGHEAYSCDIIDQSGGFPEWHIMQDVLPLLGGHCSFMTTDGVFHEVSGSWDMIYGFPPCTFMSKAGARWMYPRAGVLSFERYEKALAAKDFFLAILNADCPRVVVENPVPLKVVGLPPWSQKIQPFQFGHPYSKATCIWIRGDVPYIKPTKILSNYSPWLPSNTSAFSRGGGGSRGVAHDAKTAAKTFPGIAKALAAASLPCEVIL